jgi:hypothetical protein
MTGCIFGHITHIGDSSIFLFSSKERPSSRCQRMPAERNCILIRCVYSQAQNVKIKQKEKGSRNTPDPPVQIKISRFGEEIESETEVYICFCFRSVMGFFAGQSRNRFSGNCFRKFPRNMIGDCSNDPMQRPRRSDLRLVRA